MAVFKNELSWSFSRDRIFKECQLKYYYYYYAAWGGWEYDADPFCRKAYILKNMKNLDLWAGDIAHQVIEWAIRAKRQGIEVKLSEALKEAERRFFLGIEQSRQKMWQRNIKNNLNLFEHYYEKKTLADLGRSKFEEKVAKSLRQFFAQNFLANLDEADFDDYLSLEELDSFFYQGTKVYLKIDFALRKGADIFIYDWKTGKPQPEDTLQLEAYALYAQEKWKESLDKIKLQAVYLSQDDFILKVKDKFDLASLQRYMEESIAAMRKVLKDPEQNQADQRDFSPPVNLSLCRRCFFQELCPVPSN